MPYPDPPAEGRPRPRRSFAVLGFRTTHDALAAEQALLGSSVPVVPIPTPAVLGAECGIALRIEHGDLPRARDVLAREGVEVSSEGEIEDV